MFKHTLYRILGAVLVLVTGGCNATGQKPLQPEEFAGKLKENNVQLVDIRTAEEYQSGYIHGARNISFMDQRFAEKVLQLAKDKPVALYSSVEEQSGEAAEILVKQGFKEVYLLKGGAKAWSKAGYKFEKPLPPEPVYKKLTQQEYDGLVQSEKIVLVEFGAVWCGPCRLLKPVLSQIKDRYRDQKFRLITLDVDENKALSDKLLVNEIPLLLIYKDGVLQEQLIGFNPETIIVSSIEKYLGRK